MYILKKILIGFLRFGPIVQIFRVLTNKFVVFDAIFVNILLNTFLSA
jgi:hypothetical protein